MDYKLRGQKIRASNIAKYGSEEAYKQHLREAASKGGKVVGVKKGFAADPERARQAGIIGGTKSRRGKKL